MVKCCRVIWRIMDSDDVGTEWRLWGKCPSEHTNRTFFTTRHRPRLVFEFASDKSQSVALLYSTLFVDSESIYTSVFRTCFYIWKHERLTSSSERATRTSFPIMNSNNHVHRVYFPPWLHFNTDYLYRWSIWLGQVATRPFTVCPLSSLQPAKLRYVPSSSTL